MSQEVKLYREVTVWKAAGDGSAVRYRCFEDLATNLFCVQSADFVHLPLKEKQLQYQGRNLVELFIEDEPLHRCQFYQTLQAAVQAHDAEFSGFHVSEIIDTHSGTDGVQQPRTSRLARVSPPAGAAAGRTRCG